MSNPTPGITPNPAPALLKKGLSKSTLGIFALGALGFSAWRMQDAYTGSREKVKDKIGEMQTNNDYATGQYTFGHWSGNPGMDNLTSQWAKVKRYGPFRLREHYQATKVQISTFLNDVVGPSLLPLGVGLAGLYGAIGHTQMSKYGASFANWWRQCGFFTQYFNPTMKAVGKNIWHYGTSAVGSLLKLSFKSPVHFAVASGSALVGAVFLKRFNDTANGNAQRDNLRDEFYLRPNP